MTPTPGHMDSTAFRALGHRFVDWIADYHARVESLPVQAQTSPGDVARRLPARAPDEGLGEWGWDAVLTDLETIILPGITHWQSPNFYAYFPCSASGPAILAELLSAGLGTQGMLWATSPAATELEERVLEWLAEAIGLPPTFHGPIGGGCIQGTASEATLVAMVTARHRVLARTGADPRRLVAYASVEAHSSVTKAAMIAGLCRDADGGDGLRLVAADAGLALDPIALRAQMTADRADGRIPFFVCATVGTTSTGAVDPLRAIGAVLQASDFAKEGGWLHVDAAYAGTACLCPEHRWMLDGAEHADSVSFNPHKWMLTNFDCSAFWTRDRAGLVDALSVTPEYLRNPATDSGSVIDYRDWQIPLGRRFRALKLWFVMRHYGLEGLRAHVRHHVALAELLESWIRRDERFELTAPRSLALVCFRLRGDDAAADARNRELMDALNRSGAAYLSHTSLRGGNGERRFVLRMAIGATTTEERHVRATWDRIRSIADRILAVQR